MTKPQYVSNRPCITADGRNLAGKEWRTIPEFPKYQITEDGDIRNWRTGTILVETEHVKTGAFYYTLWKDDCPSGFARHYLKLLYSAWPELMEGWVPIPGFPLYQVNKEGQVQSKRFPDRLLPVQKGGGYRLVKDGKRHHWHFSSISDDADLWGDTDA